MRFRFQARVNAGTGGLVMNNQATVSADQVGNGGHEPRPGADRRQRDGHGAGVPRRERETAALTAGEPGLPNVSVRVTDSTGASRSVVTDATGLYSVVVPAGSTASTWTRRDPTAARLRS